jgi:Cyclin, N-terminal domain
VQTSRKNYQLLGATCLHIASKCEDVSYIGIDDLALCADKVCISVYMNAQFRSTLLYSDVVLCVNLY